MHTVTEAFNVCAAKSSMEGVRLSVCCLSFHAPFHVSQVVIFSPVQHLISTQGWTYLGQEWIVQPIWHHEHCLVCARG